MLQVNSPFAFFADSDGSPLDNGYIYIGAENLNPETNAISVYWDYAGTQPAAQPLRTVNGYIQRTGTPAQIYVSADNYSITTRNAGGGLVSTTMSVKASVITLADLADIATNTIIGRATAGTGSPELITCTAAGRALLDDAAASDQRTTLGLGTLATQDASAVTITGGTIGASVTLAGLTANAVYALLPNGSQVAFTSDFDNTRSDITAASMATKFPPDGTTPVITEGADLNLLCAHAARNTTNKVLVEAVISASMPSNVVGGMAIFAGSTCIGSATTSFEAANATNYVLRAIYTPASTGSIDYTVRTSIASGQIDLNQNNGGDSYGTEHGSYLTVTEIKAV